jgi:hypothetical protein
MIVGFDPRNSSLVKGAPMRITRSLQIALLLMVLPVGTRAQNDGRTLTAGLANAGAIEEQAAQESAAAKTVYVSDFELDSVAAKDDKSTQANNSTGTSTGTSGSQDNAPKKEEGPAEQARRMVDLMSVTLVKELLKAGYNAQRLPNGQAMPSQGVSIRGIFAEADAQNRLHRAVIGQGAIGAKMELFVGVNNLARPPQKLYEPADPASPDNNKLGAAITVSSYVPVANFEVEKNTTEKAIKDTASLIVTNLTALLNANLAALDQ